MADDGTAKVVKMRGRGRPAFEPSEFQRGQINAMVVCGIPVEEISRALGISEKTLVKFYREEILVARTKAHVEMGSFIYNTALGKGDPARRLTDERARYDGDLLCQNADEMARDEYSPPWRSSSGYRRRPRSTHSRT